MPADENDTGGRKQLAGEARVIRSAVYRVTAVVLGLAAGMILAEGTARVLGLDRHLTGKRYLRAAQGATRVDYHCYPSNPHGEFSPHPDLSKGQWKLIDYTKREYPLSAIAETPWCVEYRLSSEGLRDHEHARLPERGRSRIMVVGDSFVYGEGVPQRLTLVEQMAARLGARYELINGGAPGANTEQEARDARWLSDRFHCDRFVAVFIPNDVTLTLDLAARENRINDLINVRGLDSVLSQSWYLRHSSLARLAVSRVLMRHAARRTLDWYLDCYDPQQNGENLKRLADNLRALASIPSCRTALVLYPLLEGLDGDYRLASIHQRVGQLAVEAGLPALDLAPAFRGEATDQLWAHDCDHHPNGRAHAIAAKAIVEWLTRDVPGFLNAE